MPPPDRQGLFFFPLFGAIVLLLAVYIARFFARLHVPWIFRMADSIHPNPWDFGIPVYHNYWLFPYSPMIQATVVLIFLLALFLRYATFTVGFLLSCSSDTRRACRRPSPGT